MRYISLACMALLLAGCASTRVIDVNSVTSDIPSDVSVAKIQAPAPIDPPKWKLRNPKATPVVAGFTADDLQYFQVWVLDLSEHEAQWDNRLGSANSMIETLAKRPVPTLKPDCKAYRNKKCKR